MKKHSGLIILAIIVVAIGLAYYSHVRTIAKGPHGDPVRTVGAFMDAAVKISGLLWNEQTREAFKRDLDQWSKAAEERSEVPESFRQYGLEDPSRLFKNPRYGKGAITAFSIFSFDSYSVGQTQIGDTSAAVNISFTPMDVMGLRQLTSALGAPQSQKRPEPIAARFQLRKSTWRGWQIEEIGGEIGPAIKGFGRLRSTR